MRWQPVAVAVGLALPPVALAAAVWPSAESGRRWVGEIEVELEAGDSDQGRTDGVSSTDYLVRGEGILTIDVDGPTFDPTLTLVDPASGVQLDYDDDTNGFNPSLTVELDDGEEVVAQVRSLDGPPGGPFSIRVSEGAVDGTVETIVVGDGPTTVPNR